MNGRRYRLDSTEPGTHSLSTPTSASIEPMKSATSSSGNANRRADLLKRSALACGRNRRTEPSAHL